MARWSVMRCTEVGGWKYKHLIRCCVFCLFTLHLRFSLLEEWHSPHALYYRWKFPSPDLPDLRNQSENELINGSPHLPCALLIPWIEAVKLPTDIFSAICCRPPSIPLSCEAKSTCIKSISLPRKGTSQKVVYITSL